jgi:hypothetical protein
VRKIAGPSYNLRLQRTWPFFSFSIVVVVQRHWLRPRLRSSGRVGHAAEAQC